MAPFPPSPGLTQDRDFFLTLTSRAPGMLYLLHRSTEGRWSVPFASEGLATLFELTPADVADNATALFERIHPEDIHLLREAADWSTLHQQRFKLAYRVVLPGGRLRWHETQVLSQMAPDGTVAWYGYTNDITPQRRNEQALADLSKLLQKRTELLEAALSSTSHGVALVNPDGRLAYHNEGLAQLLKLPAAVLQGDVCLVDLLSYMLGRGDWAEAHSLQDLVGMGLLQNTAGHAQPGRLLQSTPSGRTLEIVTTEVPSGGWVCTVADVTEFITAQHDARNSALRLRSLLDSIPDRIWLKDTEGLFVDCNPQMASVYHQTVHGMIGQKAADWQSDELNALDQDTDAQALEKSGLPMRYEAELPLPLPSGGTAPFEVTKVAVFDHQHQPIGVLGVARDLTERKRAEAAIQRMAFYDPLTQLCNRLLFRERLKQAKLACQRNGHWAALCYLDLDNFKDLNDTLGHGKGDQLLQQVAKRLVDCVRAEDTVARLGGDEFVVLLNNVGPSPEQAAVGANTVGEKLRTALNQPYDLSGVVYQCSGSIGVTLFQGRGDDMDDIMKRADLAMYHAKGLGRNALSFFDAQMQAVVNARVQLESDLRLAVEREEFVLYLQPVVNGAQCITGYEALLRWERPGHGVMLPGEFMALAEQTGLIFPLGQWVLDQASRVLAQWARCPDKAQWYLAVNFSARQLRQPDFVPQVLQALEGRGANPQLLRLELTESLLLQDVEDTIHKMRALAAHGIRFALDDFGTGYSSLSYLKRLPLATLKIDHSFVQDLLVDDNDQAIAGMVLSLAKNLGLVVVAEGVETEAQFERLQAMGCPLFQGYLFGKPVPWVPD